MSDTPYQRLVIEKVELGGKMVKLTQFIFNSDGFDKLDEENKELILEQLHVMMTYFHILAQRIKAFKDW